MPGDDRRALTSKTTDHVVRGYLMELTGDQTGDLGYNKRIKMNRLGMRGVICVASMVW